MAETGPGTGKNPPTAKFRAHGVQSEWLDSAKGRLVEMVLNNGDDLKGRLIGYDIYCLSLDEAGQEGNTLIYKQSISFVRISKE